MNRLITCFLLIIYSVCSKSNDCETFSYDLYLLHECDKNIIKANNFWLTANKEDSVYNFVPDSNGCCKLPFDGKFKLNYISSKGSIFKDINITSNRIDTIIIPPIYLSSTSNSNGPRYYSYYHCGVKCDGKYKIYRSDKKLWQTGRFQNGQVRKLISFYSNGIIESKRKDGFLCDYFYEYDNNGKLLMKFDFIIFYSNISIYNAKKDEYIIKRFFGHY